MAFHFSLQSVLRFRQGVEQQQLLLLQAANLRAAAVRREIETMSRYLAEIGSSNQRELSAGVNAAQLHCNELCRSAALHRRSQMEEELTLRAKACASLNLEFQQARKQHEVLKTLRDRQFDLYRRKQDRQEQRHLDDMLLLRRAFLHRG